MIVRDFTEASNVMQVRACITSAASKFDTERLTRLHRALTTARAASYYAGLSEDDAAGLADEAKAATRQIKSQRQQQPKPEPRQRQPKPEPQLQNKDLFEDVGRWPRRPYCSDDLAYGVRIRSLKQAVTCPYLQANPPNIRVWTIFDVDRPGAGLAWEAAGLPPPAWGAINSANGHAHLVWGLRAPVLVDSPDMRQAPLRYLCAVESLMRERLQADPGYSGLITKNPAHPLWHVLRGPVQAYDLKDLADALPGIEKHRPKRVKVEQVGLGRNITLFEWLRQYAYRHIRQYKAPSDRNYILWQAHLNVKGLEHNGEFASPLQGNECWHVAKSVAKWTWRHFDLAASDKKFSELQAHRSKAGHMARWGDSEDKQSSARLMRAAGHTYRAIADELGVSLSTVHGWCS